MRHETSDVAMPMSLTGIEAFVFDAYGTLLDLNGAVAPVAARLGDRATNLLKVWRAKQIEYSWLRSLMGRHADFAEVTSEALDYACAAAGTDAADLRPALLDAFFHLPAYPDARPLLDALRARDRTAGGVRHRERVRRGGRGKRRTPGDLDQSHGCAARAPAVRPER